MFRFKNGYKLNLESPQTFNEKIVYKKLFHRSPLMVLTSDKYRARDYIREKVGPEAEKYLVPLLWHGKSPDDIPFDDLPDSYIIKPNNGAGRWVICKEGKFNVNKVEVENLTRDGIRWICREWFKSVHGQKWNEWVYSQIEPELVIEKLLTRSDGEVPFDYRFCMFGGKLTGLFGIWGF